ncbi:unnamed protein product [Peronospora belbahrii]|uniref:[Histone H3]-lysine(27) N-trimethyltransferase n=1 Tax=Peronospora belbahrii TaxID=622444 RepID=A0ABN8D1W4_9STRA|nr:unnamed protein product [Peronospora belbahrii]
MSRACQVASRKRSVDGISLEDREASKTPDTEMEEQLCAQAAETLNHFIQSFHIFASTEMARNRLKSSLYLSNQRRHRKEYSILADGIFDKALQGYKVQTSELPGLPDRYVKRTVKIHLVNRKTQTSVNRRAVILPKVPPIPTATMWTALTTNFEVEDEPTLKFVPYFGDDDEDDVVSAFYQIKQQRTSACEVEFTKEMCEGVLKALQATWDLTVSDLKRVANVLKVEEEVLVEVHKHLRLSQHEAKKRRRVEAIVVVKGQTNSNMDERAKDDLLNSVDPNISMDEYVRLYEKLADSYRSLFCRRCFVYDCDYHGCKEQSKLIILEQNAVARNMEEKRTMINTGRNCENNCFLSTTSSSSFNGISKARAVSATFKWNRQTSILCARTYIMCAGNFCEMAKIIGDKNCKEVAEICAYCNINDRSLPIKARVQSKCRRSRKKKSARMSIAHLQNSRNGVVNSVQIKIEPCSHLGSCEPGICSCVEDGIFCSKHCHCVHDECKIFFSGCQCQRGRCRTKACPCFCAGRECDIDLCKVCSADEIAVREKGELFYNNNSNTSDNMTIDDRHETTCQNRSIALGKQKHVRMGRSKLRAAGWGLFVDDFVAKDEFIIEYIGEMVSQEEADRRGAVYDKVDCSYLFNLDTKTVIDSTRKGNKTRFINHSSKSPNCICKIMNVSSDFRIGLFATHDIQPHTELFFDYGFDKELYHAELVKQPNVTQWMKE